MSAPTVHHVRVIDSHTAGEPTRVVVEGGPDLGRGSMSKRRAILSQRHAGFRAAVVNEPRGSEVLVGAMLCPASEASCAAGVVFFNNVGCLGMCGHGAIGVITTLAHLGRIAPGKHRLDTPVGIVTACLNPDGTVSVENVPCWRQAQTVRIEVPGHGAVEGDVAYGGNWFYLVKDHLQILEKENVESLTSFTRRVRAAVNGQGHPEVDHVELLGPPTAPGAHARNFVLCPGGAYDRSPCGTGTSAKLACLAAAGEWPENTPWIQEGILGTVFTGRYRWLDQAEARITPTIQGAAFVTAESTLLLDKNDPFCWGI